MKPIDRKPSPVTEPKPKEKANTKPENDIKVVPVEELKVIDEIIRDATHSYEYEIGAAVVVESQYAESEVENEKQINSVTRKQEHETNTLPRDKDAIPLTNSATRTGGCFAPKSHPKWIKCRMKVAHTQA